MKKSKTQTRNSNAVVVATPTVIEPLPVFEDCESKDAAERVRFHLSQAREHGRCTIAHIIEAGRELALQKQLLGYGQWKVWCENSLDISQDTADRYIATFQKTIGAARLEQGVALDKKILKKELEAATVGMEEKTVRQAMIEIGVIKSHSSWGGKRDGAGRKAKDEAATVGEQLDAIANNETLLWSSLKGALDTLVKMDTEKDIWNRLEDNHLATAVRILAEAEKKSSEAMMKRIK